MKKLLFISILALVLAGCEKNEQVPVTLQEDSIYATIETSADTKANLVPGTDISDPISVIWENDDLLSVFVQIGEEIKNVKFVLESGAGEKTGVFSKAADEQTDLTGATYLSAVYPYNANAHYNQSTRTISNMVAAKNYTYSAESYKKAAPMAGLFTENNIAFKNVGSLIKVTTSNIPDGYNTIVLGSETNAIAGDYNIQLSSTGVPTTILVGEGEKSVAFESAGNKEIYLPIFPGTYKDMYLKAVNDNESISLFSTKSLNAQRSSLYYTSVVLSSAATQQQLEEVISENTLATNINVDLGDDLSEVIVPPTTEKQAVTLSFKTDEPDIEVSQGTEEEEQVLGNVNINLTTEDNTSTKNLSVNLPSSTVTVSGSTTYEKIIASTSDNTLILDAGVVANTVVVKKGNIQVNKGATLNKIEFGTEEGDATSVIVIVNGGTVSDEVKAVENVTVMTKAEFDFRSTMEKGEISRVYLTEDLTITGKAINITNNVVLYLGGHKLTYTGNDALFRVSNGASLYFSASTPGSEIYTKAEYPTETTYNGYIAVLTDGAELDLIGGTYSVGTRTLFLGSEGCTIWLGKATFEAREDLTVNGNPNFYNDNKKYTIDLVDGKGTIDGISSGTYVGYDPSNKAGDNSVPNFVSPGYSVIYNETEDTYTVQKGIYNEYAFNVLMSKGAGWNSIPLGIDINTDMLDFSNLTNNLVLDLNSHTITITDTCGVKFKEFSKAVEFKNGEIIIKKPANSTKFNSGILFEDGDYSSASFRLTSMKVSIADDTLSSLIYLTSGANNMKDLYINSSEIIGAHALECWGDNNYLGFLRCKLTSNFSTTANAGASCIVLQNNGTNIAENNKLGISNCEFIYDGINLYNQSILSIASGSETNQVSLYDCTFGDGVTPY